MEPDDGRDGWATDPHDTRERTCEWDLPPVFCLRHRLRVTRSPAPDSVTVTRTHEASVEWTADADLPGWLGSVATVLTPYGRDRTPVTDGRFRATPVDATVRPPDGDGPGLTDPYHYWNTPLARLRADDHFPGGVASATVDLVDGPDAVWTGDSAVGAAVRVLDGGFDPAAHSRVGLEVTGRERFRCPDDDYHPAGEATTPDLAGLAGLVEATLAESVRDALSGSGVDRALRTAIDRVDAVWAAFQTDDDPYAIPDAAVETATAPADLDPP